MKRIILFILVAVLLIGAAAPEKVRAEEDNYMTMEQALDSLGYTYAASLEDFVTGSYVASHPYYLIYRKANGTSGSSVYSYDYYLCRFTSEPVSIVGYTDGSGRIALYDSAGNKLSFKYVKQTLSVSATVSFWNSIYNDAYLFYKSGYSGQQVFYSNFEMNWQGFLEQPSITVSPIPTPTSTPVPTPTNTPVPTPTNTPVPTPTNTPVPTPTNTPVPTLTPTSTPTPLPTSTPTPTPHVCTWTNRRNAASCLTAGSEWQECPGCGDVRNMTSIPATGHSPVRRILVSPTLNTAGQYEETCYVCGMFLNSGVIPVLTPTPTPLPPSPVLMTDTANFSYIVIMVMSLMKDFPLNLFLVSCLIVAGLLIFGDLKNGGNRKGGKKK